MVQDGMRDVVLRDTIYIERLPVAVYAEGCLHCDAVRVVHEVPVRGRAKTCVFVVV